MGRGPGAVKIYFCVSQCKTVLKLKLKLWLWWLMWCRNQISHCFSAFWIRLQDKPSILSVFAQGIPGLQWKLNHEIIRTALHKNLRMQLMVLMVFLKDNYCCLMAWFQFTGFSISLCAWLLAQVTKTPHGWSSSADGQWASLYIIWHWWLGSSIYSRNW